jgi:hypothetical protein
MSMGAGEKEETSGFFPYFMLLSIVCITAYLVFHNKQKVSATFSQRCWESLCRPVFRIRIGSGFYQVSGSGSRFGILIQVRNPDPDAGGQKWPTKIEKSEEISCFEVLDVLF